MFKKIIQTSIAFCLLFTAGRIQAQRASQPVFTIVDGSAATESNSANPSISLPVLGFVLDQSGGLRPVMGIAGSASVGSPLNLGFSVAQAAMPATHDYILAMTGTSAWPVLLQVRGNTISVRRLETGQAAISPMRLIIAAASVVMRIPRPLIRLAVSTALPSVRRAPLRASSVPHRAAFTLTAICRRRRRCCVLSIRAQ